MTQALQTLRDKPSARWTALILLAMAMFFSYIFMDILSPLKDILETQRHWDSTAFGTYAGSETFLNVFIFFLIIAGIILDKMGVRFTALPPRGALPSPGPMRPRRCPTRSRPVEERRRRPPTDPHLSIR